MFSKLAVLLLLACSCLSFAVSLPNDLVVNTTYGAYQGTSDALSGVNLFLGIPYASPPVGALRFRPPVAPPMFTGVHSATSFGNICPQARLGDIVFGSEDCLYLNVYIPATQPDDPPLPVMFWIYGGGYMLGDGYEFGLYDAKNIASTHNVIVVTHNYRLGPFGFLAHKELMLETPLATTGNYGVQDQSFALQWVQQNIANFGGDPSRVTIFGESAGAFSVCWHLVNPNDKGLFAGAIMESGTCDSPDFFQRLDRATSFGDVYVDAIGCNSTVQGDQFLNCIRNLSTADVMTPITSELSPSWPHSNGSNNGFVPLLAPFMPFGPAIDGSSVGLTDVPLNLIQRGAFNAVPTVMGTNENEGSIFIFAVPLIQRNVSLPLNDQTLAVTMGHFFNASTVAQVLDLYPAYQFPDDDTRAARILRDFFFVCGNRRAARAISNQGTSTYLYHFTYKEDWIEYPFLGDYHSAELEFVFANPWPPLIHAFSANDATMASTFGTYWTNLAKYGNPNGNGFNTTWPQYTAAAENNIIMDVPTSIQQQYQEGPCDFWDSTYEPAWQ